MPSERQRQLAAKRAEAQKLLTRVNAKASRLRREKNVEIAGTQYDVRVSRDTLRRARSRDLDRYIRRFRGFVDRGTQFVAGDSGTPLPADKARRLTQLETDYTQRGRKLMDQIGGFQAPFSGMSIADREKQMRPSVKAGGERLNRTFESIQTQYSNIVSLQALDKLIDRVEKRLDPGYVDKRVKLAREQVGQIFDRIGQSEMRAKVDALTDEQFFVYWEYGPYANDFGVQYDIIKRQQEGNYSPSDTQQIDDINEELAASIEWASNLPSDINIGKREAQSRTRNTKKKRR